MTWRHIVPPLRRRYASAQELPLRPTRRLLTVATLLLLAASMLARAQRVVFAVSYRDTQASRNARPHPTIFTATPDEKVAMVRALLKTEIYAVDFSGKRALLFSDEQLKLELQPNNESGYVIVRGDKAYMPGVERRWQGQPSPGVFSDPPAMFELTLDGSNRFRKLFEVPTNSTPLIINPAGTKAFLSAFVGDRYVAFVYDTTSWKLLQHWDMDELLHAHCPDCMPITQGWAGDDQLFFRLEMVGDDDDADPKRNLEGIYVVHQDGSDAGTLTREPDRPMISSKRVPSSKAPAATEQLLVITGPDGNAQKALPLQNSKGARLFQLSPSGKFLLFVEDRLLKNYTTERHLWAKDLATGEEKELYVLAAPRYQNPEPNTTLTVLGWAEP
jgi:hypothetical protein